MCVSAGSKLFDGYDPVLGPKCSPRFYRISIYPDFAIYYQPPNWPKRWSFQGTTDAGGSSGFTNVLRTWEISGGWGKIFLVAKPVRFLRSK